MTQQLDPLKTIEQASIQIKKIYDCMYEDQMTNNSQNAVIGYCNVEELEKLLTPEFFSTLKDYFEQKDPEGFREKVDKYRESSMPKKY